MECKLCKRNNMSMQNDSKCRSCYKVELRYRKKGVHIEELTNNKTFEKYYLLTDNKGWFKKGNILGKETQFKKGHTPINKGKRENIQRNHHTYRKDLGVKKGEVIHHIDGDYLNNNPDNIIVFKNQSEHMKYHWEQQNEKGRMKTTKT